LWVASLGGLYVLVDSGALEWADLVAGVDETVTFVDAKTAAFSLFALERLRGAARNEDPKQVNALAGAEPAAVASKVTISESNYATESKAAAAAPPASGLHYEFDFSESQFSGKNGTYRQFTECDPQRANLFINSSCDYDDQLSQIGTVVTSLSHLEPTVTRSVLSLTETVVTETEVSMESVIVDHAINMFPRLRPLIMPPLNRLDPETGKVGVVFALSPFLEPLRILVASTTIAPLVRTWRKAFRR